MGNTTLDAEDITVNKTDNNTHPHEACISSEHRKTKNKTKTDNRYLYNMLSSVAWLYPPLCDPIDCSMPGLLVLHQLLELAQTHIH